MTQDTKRYGTIDLIKRFLPYYGRYKKIVFFDLFCAALTTACELVFPMLVRNITGVAVNSPENLTLFLILKTAGIYVLLRILDTVAYHYMAGNGPPATSWAPTWRPTCGAIFLRICRPSPTPIIRRPRSGRLCRALRAIFSTSPSLRITARKN